MACQTTSSINLTGSQVPVSESLENNVKRAQHKLKCTNKIAELEAQIVALKRERADDEVDSFLFTGKDEPEPGIGTTPSFV
jgi:ribonuclease HI